MNRNMEDDCINAVRTGLKEGFTHLTPEMEKLFRMVYQLGYKQSKIDRLENDLEPLTRHFRD